MRFQHKKKEVPSVLKQLLCGGPPLPMRFYANFTKGHELEEQKARSREKKRRAKLRRAAPRDEHNIEQVSGDTKN